MSTASQAEVARAHRAAAKYGLIGAVAGSVVAGIGAFIGAFLTYKVQTDTHDEDTRRAAYVEFVAETQDYRGALFAIHRAVESSDQKAYDEALAETSRAGAELYAATATIYILKERKDPTAVAATNVNNALINERAARVEDFDLEASRRALERASRLQIVFLDAARTDMQGE